jgi:hypothetical protein
MVLHSVKSHHSNKESSLYFTLLRFLSIPDFSIADIKPDRPLPVLQASSGQQFCALDQRRHREFPNLIGFALKLMTSAAQWFQELLRLTANFFLQSTHPIPAERHSCSIVSTSACDENILWKENTLQTSGLPDQCGEFAAYP